MLKCVSTYTVVVALHIIAVIAAYGLPLSAPLLVPYVRRHHPTALAGLHAAQHRLNNVLTGPATVLLLGFGIYLATDGKLWDEPFVGIGIAAIVIIAVVGGGVIVPATKQLARLDPLAPEYERVYRRLRPRACEGGDANSFMTAEVFLGIVVLLTIFAMAAKPFS
jgi:uncharacterized membrane protein